MNKRAFLFTQDDALQGAVLGHVEDLDREVLFAAERKGRGVHHLEVRAKGLIEREFVKHRRVGMELRVGRVDAVDLRGLEDDFRTDFGAAKRRVVSVVMKGLPVPAAKITTRPRRR